MVERVGDSPETCACKDSRVSKFARAGAMLKYCPASPIMPPLSAVSVAVKLIFVLLVVTILTGFVNCAVTVQP